MIFGASRVTGARAGLAATAVALLLGACGEGSHSGPAPQTRDCTTTATQPEEAQAALDRAAPGQKLCFSGTGLASADLVLSRSGAPEAPITLHGLDVTVRSVTVESDQVVVDGFTTDQGEGLVLAGAGITARDNTVLDAQQDGISCEVCTDVLLEGNVVERADGTGIIVEGERISVLSNEVLGSVRKEANDADGIRFFGRGHRISHNTIRDIKDDGYFGEPPHTDCFQTYDNSRLSTTDVVISDNRCTNVDHQCLIATAEQLRRSHTIRFLRNTCAVEGKQALLLGYFPGVEVRGNDITGPNLHRGVSLLNGSRNGSIFDNRFLGEYRHFEADESSLPGLRSGGNASG